MSNTEKLQSILRAEGLKYILSNTVLYVAIHYDTSIHRLPDIARDKQAISTGRVDKRAQLQPERNRTPELPGHRDRIEAFIEN